MQRRASADMFWHLILANIIFQFLRFGGQSMVDVLIHGGMVLAAMAAMAWQGKAMVVKKSYVLGFGLLLIAALIQLIPLSSGMFSALAPIKARLISEVSALVPGLAVSREIAVIPAFHGIKTAMWGLDVVWAMLLLAAPKPRLAVIYGWLVALSLSMGSVAVIQGRGLISPESLLAPYADTYGGLLNYNHFGLVAVVLMVLLLARIALGMREIKKLLTANKRHIRGAMVREYAWCTLSLLGWVALLWGFQYGISRSAILIFVLAHSCFGLLLAYDAFRLSRFPGLKAGVVLVLLLGALIALPLGRGVARLSERGLDSNGRLAFFEIGLSYLEEWPLLGTGLGSTECLLSEVAPSTPQGLSIAREFHNDWLQFPLEWGIIGVAGLLVLLVQLARDLLGGMKSGTHTEERWLSHAVIAAGLSTAALSLVSFPLRVTAVRLLIFALLAVGLKMGGENGTQPPSRRLLTGLFLLWVASFGALTWMVSIHQHPKAGENPQIAFSQKYGRYFRYPLFEANEQLAEVLRSLDDREFILESIPGIRAHLRSFLAQQPLSLKALNLWFLLDLLDYRLERPGFDRQAFERFKEKANAIQALGRDANLRARLSKVLLYMQYEDQLTEEERAQLDGIRKWVRGYLNELRQQGELLE